MVIVEPEEALTYLQEEVSWRTRIRRRHKPSCPWLRLATSPCQRGSRLCGRFQDDQRRWWCWPGTEACPRPRQAHTGDKQDTTQVQDLCTMPAGFWYPAPIPLGPQYRHQALWGCHLPVASLCHTDGTRRWPSRSCSLEYRKD
ncbi:hypothetical protein UPYG_G00260810 [Umbra pygmaea]|uniref:Uncharacterized protein n=1 Tax=Umbra pygmaea TaxID=75934 RepID=A0ABD0W916_UMBPY